MDAQKLITILSLSCYVYTYLEFCASPTSRVGMATTWVNHVKITILWVPFELGALSDLYNVYMLCLCGRRPDVPMSRDYKVRVLVS